MCEIDRKTVFEEEQFYTIKCEACGKFCKLYKYRSCQERFQWNSDNGLDIFKEYRQLEGQAFAQMGISPPNTIRSSDVSSENQNNKSKKNNRRGR